MPIVAPWIQAPDVAGQYSRGLGLGAQIQQETERLKAENARTTMEGQARQEANMRQSELERARIATEQAYRTIQTNIAQERLQLAARSIDARTKQAALIARDQALFNQDVAGGMAIPTAMARHPLARAQQAITQQQNETRDKALAQHRATLESQGQQRVDIAQAEADRRRNAAVKPVRTGETTETVYDPDHPNTQRKVTKYQFAPKEGETPSAAADHQQSFTKGQKVKQGGKTYQFDGQNWNELGQ